MDAFILPLAIIVGAYLLGSISFAYLAAKAKGIDLRQHGSGNLGATNAGRVMGGKWFAIVFLLDVAKGVAPALIMRLLAPETGTAIDPWWPVFAALSTVLGHVFTCFHGFRGGKAVATSLGVLIALVPVIAAIAFGTFLLVWLVGKFVFGAKSSSAVAPGSLLGSTAASVSHCWLTWPAFAPEALPPTLVVIIMNLIIIVRHRSNIAGMFAGKRTEQQQTAADAKTDT